MLLLLFSLSGLGCCALVVLIFGLMGAGRRADEGEEKILKIILPASHIKEQRTRMIMRR